jgi:hypothetical protein
MRLQLAQAPDATSGDAAIEAPDATSGDAAIEAAIRSGEAGAPAAATTSPAAAAGASPPGPTVQQLLVHRICTLASDHVVDIRLTVAQQLAASGGKLPAPPVPAGEVSLQPLWGWKGVRDALKRLQADSITSVAAAANAIAV